MSASITTKGGDKGYTSLLGGLRVPKYDLRPSTYGSVDEMGSILGIARSASKIARIQEIVLAIQKDLFEINAELASSMKERKFRIFKQHIFKLEEFEDEAEKTIVMPTTFIIPGGSFASAFLDHARSVCRRAERNTIKMLHLGYLTNENIIIYLNRLSDLLWLLARWEEQKGQ